jgi:hypothetical protein
MYLHSRAHSVHCLPGSGRGALSQREALAGIECFCFVLHNCPDGSAELGFICVTQTLGWVAVEGQGVSL